jgi:hypothetical protein
MEDKKKSRVRKKEKRVEKAQKKKRGRKEKRYTHFLVARIIVSDRN